MEMLGMLLTSWPRMLVFLGMTVGPNSLQACAKQLMSSCRASSVCAVRAASSTNTISLIPYPSGSAEQRFGTCSPWA